MGTTSGSWPIEIDSSNSRIDARATARETGRLLLLGVIAVAIHVATRRRIELGPGHQGLIWIAMLVIGRLTSTQSWAGTTTAIGATAATMLPFWRLGDPFLGLSYTAAGIILDLGSTALGRFSTALWGVALLGGIAHAAKPLIRTVIQVGGWRYETLVGGLSFPTATHFLFGAAGALIGAAAVNALRNHEDPAQETRAERKPQ